MVLHVLFAQLYLLDRCEFKQLVHCLVRLVLVVL